MEFDTVFITTSGLGTRLEGLTQYTNKALVPIGDQYAICRIVERFKPSTHFVVTLGYYGDHVRDFLELAYPTHRFTFVTVDPYEGPGSSQAYSMLCAASHLDKPFLYHCCDTILSLDYTLVAPNNTSPITLYVAPHADYTTYSGITVKDGKMVRFNRKRETIHDYVYIGVAYIADPVQFWGALRQAVGNEGGHNSFGDAPVCKQTWAMNPNLGDTDAYRHLLTESVHLDYRVVPTFYDTGNIDSYRHACRAFPSSATVLAKPNESICFLKDQRRVLKFLHSIPSNAKRVTRGRALAADGAPAILDARPNFMVMSYEEGEVASECREWGIVKQVLDWAHTRLWSITHTDPHFRNVCRRFYYDKTMQRLAAYKAKQHEDIEVVNGTRVGTIGALMDSIDWPALFTDRFTRFHGDFILDNILRKPNGEFVMLDWRECFDTELEWGDSAYDLAKLRHNLVFHHGTIAKGGYIIQKEGDQVFVELTCKYGLMRQLEELDAWVAAKGWNVTHIRILQALIWLNMAPLYEAPLSDFLYYFGKWNLSLAVGAAAATAATTTTC